MFAGPGCSRRAGGARLAALHCSWISCGCVCLRIPGEGEERAWPRACGCKCPRRLWAWRSTHCSLVCLAGPRRLSACIGGQVKVCAQVLLVTLSGGVFVLSVSVAFEGTGAGVGVCSSCTVRCGRADQICE